MTKNKKNLACVAATAASAALFFFGAWLHPVAALAVPSIWVTALYGASLAGPTGVIGTLSTIQADVPAVIQIASITGAWGIEFLVMLAPAALAVLAAPGIPARARLRAPALLAVALAVVLGYGFTRLSTVDDRHETRRVAVLARTDQHWAVDVATPA